MGSTQDWPHLATPGVLRTRAKHLAMSHRDMLSQLVDIRVAKGMKQSDVADILGISQQRVSALESYDSNPRLDTIRRYAAAVGAIIDINVLEDTPENREVLDGASWAPHQPLWLFVTNVDKPAQGWSTTTRYTSISKRADFALMA